jgi:hypothetical protein
MLPAIDQDRKDDDGENSSNNANQSDIIHSFSFRSISKYSQRTSTRRCRIPGPHCIASASLGVSREESHTFSGGIEQVRCHTSQELRDAELPMTFTAQSLVSMVLTRPCTPSQRPSAGPSCSRRPRQTRAGRSGCRSSGTRRGHVRWSATVSAGIRGAFACTIVARMQP